MIRTERSYYYRKKFYNSVFYLLVAAITVAVFFPFYWMLNTSMLTTRQLFQYPPQFIPTENFFLLYASYLSTSPFLIWLRNSVVVSSIATFVSTFLAIFGAYSICRFNYRGKVLFIFIILLTQMLPRVLIIIPIYIIFINFQLNNTLIGLTLLYTVITVPIGLWFLKGFFDTIPKELEESAIIDGCSRVAALFKIIIPLSVPGIMATATWSYIIAWDEFVFANTILSSERLWTLSIGLASHIGQYSVDWGQIMIGAVLATIPIGVMFLYFQKYLLSGLTAGSVKG